MTPIQQVAALRKELAERQKAMNGDGSKGK